MMLSRMIIVGVGLMLAAEFVSTDDLVAARKIFHEKLISNGILTSCENCEHSKAILIESTTAEFVTFETLKCTKWDSIPPHKILVFGCCAWEMAIPF